MNTMLYEFVEPLKLMILVHADKAPSHAEWDPYAAMCQEKFAKNLMNKVFVFGDGPGPSASQREKLRYEPRKEWPLHSAVITHSLVARGLVTALSWFYEIRGFAPSAIDDAFEYLSIPRSQWLMVRTNVAQKRMRLSGTYALDEKVELTDTIGTLDEIVTARLPKLRAQVQRARASSLR